MKRMTFTLTVDYPETVEAAWERIRKDVEQQCRSISSLFNKPEKTPDQLEALHLLGLAFGVIGNLGEYIESTKSGIVHGELQPFVLGQPYPIGEGRDGWGDLTLTMTMEGTVQ